METKIIQIQFALFPYNYFEQDLTGLYNRLITINEFKDGQNQDLQVPSDVPRDFPRILLRSKDNKYRCDYGFNKFDVVVDYGDGLSFDKKYYSELSTVTNNVIRQVSEKIIFNRVGLIIKYYYFVDDPMSELGKIVKSKSFTDRLSSFQFRITYSLDLNILSYCNHLITVSSGKIVVNKIDKKIIHLEEDINTPIDAKVNFSVDSVIKFGEQAIDAFSLKNTYSKIMNKV